MFNLSLCINTSKNYSVSVLLEKVVQRCPVKNVFLKISQNSQKNIYAGAYFLIKLQGARNLLKKETLAQVFCCEFCGILKKTFFIEHIWWLLLYFTDIEGRCLNKFGKYLSCRGVFRTHTNNWDWEVCGNSCLEWLTIVAKISILDVWKSCGYASQLDK